MSTPAVSSPRLAARAPHALQAACWGGALLLLLTSLPASAQLRPGGEPATSAASTPESGQLPTLGDMSTPTEGPGLYAGIKDGRGRALSWVRINALKDRGEQVASLRVRWGKGLIELPLVDMSAMELYYSEGHIQVRARLLSGDTVQGELANPYTELLGWWRQNPYTIALSDVRQIWFQYVPSTAEQATRYTGPARRLRVEGFVKSLEMRAGGGTLRLLTSKGEALELPWAGADLRKGSELLGTKASFLPGRAVRAVYTLGAGPRGVAERRLVELVLVRAQAAP